MTLKLYLVILKQIDNSKRKKNLYKTIEHVLYKYQKSVIVKKDVIDKM